MSRKINVDKKKVYDFPLINIFYADEKKIGLVRFVDITNEEIQNFK